MKKKSIFSASFEESLNLLDDSVSGKFAQDNYQDALKKEKYRGTLKSYVWLVILTILFIIGPNWLIVALNDSPLLGILDGTGNMAIPDYSREAIQPTVHFNL